MELPTRHLARRAGGGVACALAAVERRGSARGVRGFGSVLGMALLRRFRSWWNKDAIERAEEETRMTEGERDTAEEDYEMRKDDVAVRSGRLSGGVADYERDSEPPRS